MVASNVGRFGAYSVIGTVSLMPLLVLPAMVGLLVDEAGMSDQSAGWSASLNFFGGALTGLVMSLTIHSINLRRLCRLALVLAVACDIASALTAGPGLAFLVARGIAGVMLGVAYVSSVSAFARLEDYERGFGVFVTLQFIVSGLGLYLVPVFAEQLGPRGLFYAFATLDALALLLARSLPDVASVSSGRRSSETEVSILMSAAVLAAVLAFLLFEAANNAQFTYIERFAVALDFSERQIGLALLVASLIGIPGAFSIVVTGNRFGTLPALAVGIGIALVGLAILLNTETYVAYFIGSCCMGFSWAFCLPYIQSLLASLDRHGSAIAAGTSLSTLGSALGPGAAALVVVGGNYTNVFWLAVALFLLALTGFVFSARHRRVTAGLTEGAL